MRSPRRRDAGRPRVVALSHTGLVSGAEIVLLRVLRAAAAEGWEVTCFSPPGAMTERLADAGLPVRHVPDLKLPGGPRPLAAGLLALRSAEAGRRLRREAADADVILVNGILALPALAAARVRTPAAWIVHDIIHKRSWLLLLRVFGAAVDRAIAVSEAAARPIRQTGLQARVVRNGVQWPVEPATGGGAGPPVVGCAALLTPWKGQRVLLEAVARLGRRDVIVELLGGSFPKDGPYVEELRRRAAKPDLENRVRFLGHVPNPLDTIRRWTVAVSPSVDPEAGPLALLEYMSVGVAAVATGHGGSPEVIDDAGLLVPPRDVQALADAIGRLIEDRDLRERLAANGPRVIERNDLTVDAFQRHVLACLRETALLRAGGAVSA